MQKDVKKSGQNTMTKFKGAFSGCGWCHGDGCNQCSLARKKAGMEGKSVYVIRSKIATVPSTTKGDILISEKVLTEEQLVVLEKLQQGAVIGEVSKKINGQYKLFSSRRGIPEVSRLNKNTVFAMLTLGLIKKDNSIEGRMGPLSRDCWYVYAYGDK